MKRTIVFFLMAAISLTMVACSSSGDLDSYIPSSYSTKTEEPVQPTELDRFQNDFEILFRFNPSYWINGYTVYYARDPVTDVMYMWAVDTGITVMLDPDTGLPLTYNHYLELSKEANNQVFSSSPFTPSVP